jgi:hypothetical protein
LVAGNEIFLLSAYLYAFATQLQFPSWAITLNLAGVVIGFVLFAIKKMMSVIQLISASQQLAAIDI